MARPLLLVLATLLAWTPALAQAPDPDRLLARADSAFEQGDTAAARAGYTDVLRLAPYQSRAVYQLGLLETPGSAEQIRLFARYTELEPDDAWGFAALGDAYRDADSAAEARTAYRRGLELAPDATDIAAALAALDPAPAEPPSRARAFSIEPITRVARDSDGNTTSQFGAGAALRFGDGGSVGIQAARTTAGDGFTSVAAWTAAVEARLRWRPARGPAVELRGRYGPVAATPLLLSSPVLLSEVRATVDLALVGALHARGIGRHGALRDSTGANTRMMVGAGPVLRLAPGLELNVLAARSGYAEPAGAGYFAPEAVDALDLGVYWEREAGPLVLALDAGAGLERLQPFGASRGGWGRSLRLWSQVGWSFSPRAALRVEAEAYDTRAGEALVATAGAWRWGSLSASVVVRP